MHSAILFVFNSRLATQIRKTGKDSTMVPLYLAAIDNRVQRDVV